MSLKAKLEAVIYAAEEPVTLTQLASLFAADALEWKAAQAAAAAEEAAEAASETLDQSLPLLNEGPETAEEAAAPSPEADAPLDEPPAAQAEEAASGEDAAPEKPVQAEDAELEAKRLARLREREVKAILKQLLDELLASYTSDDRGIEMREIAGGYRMATKPACHDAVRLFVKSLKPPLKLSLPALETLAVVAYKQPVTAPEVSEIRGVESGGVLGSLLSRKLVATAGRKQVIGRPILYKTTKEFLLRFGLRDLAELPSMEEFEKMAAIEIEEEMEPEATAADAAKTAAEDTAGTEDALAASSPSGEELAEELAEASEDREPAHDGALAAKAKMPATPTEDLTAATADNTETPSGPSNELEAAPAQPDPTQAETETSSDAQEEIHEER